MVKRDYGRDLDIGVPRDEAQNVRVSVDEVIDNALKAVTDTLDESNMRLKRVDALTGLTMGIPSDEEVG